jgi:hypothetical protein
MIPFTQLAPLDQWRERFRGRRRRTQLRPRAGLGYLIDDRPVDGLIEIEKLTLVLLYDESIRPGNCALRLAGHAARRVPWGVRFGGIPRCRFLKDLFLQPVPDGVGYRLDLANEELLTLGLQLDRELDRTARFRRHVRELPFLPRLWAGFEPDVAIGVTIEGPELRAYAARIGKTPQHLMERLRCQHQGLTLYPFSWVSHHWQAATAVYADLRQMPKLQVFRLEKRGDLRGFHDAAEFDFVVRTSMNCRHVRRRRPAFA